MTQRKTTVIGLAVFVAFVVGIFGGWPLYRVWQRELRGEAALREAQWDRQIRIEEANAELEAAKLLRQAELERALGLADAIDAIAGQLAGSSGEAYLRYRWIEGLHNENSEVIYVPTPIEAAPGLSSRPSSCAPRGAWDQQSERASHRGTPTRSTVVSDYGGEDVGVHAPERRKGRNRRASGD